MLSLTFGGSRLLLFDILSFMHDGQSPLVLASERSVLDGDRFKVVVCDIESEWGSSPKAVYVRDGARANTTDLKVGVVVEGAEVSVGLGECPKGGCSLKLFCKLPF